VVTTKLVYLEVKLVLAKKTNLVTGLFNVELSIISYLGV
jgi:hypothetical protein